MFVYAGDDGGWIWQPVLRCNKSWICGSKLLSDLFISLKLHNRSIKPQSHKAIKTPWMTEMTTAIETMTQKWTKLRNTEAASLER